MDIATRLELLLEVSEHGSFAKAADARNIDRSVLSKQIKNLEETLGLRLLNRSTRSLSLTTAGFEIVKQAEKVREVLEQTRRLADTFHHEPKGHLRISSSTMFGRFYIQKAVKAFMSKYPQVSIDLVLDDRKVDIISERFDVVFRIGPPKDSNLIARKLADNPFAILASEEFVNKHGYPKTPQELVALPSVIYSNGAFTINKLEIAESPGDSEIKTFATHGRYKVNEAELILDGIQEGLGYAQVGLFMLPKNIKEMGLVPLLTDHKLPMSHGGIYAVYSHRNQPPLVKQFIETVQEIIGTPPVWESYIDNYEALYK